MIMDFTVYSTHATKSQVHCCCPAPSLIYFSPAMFLPSCLFSPPCKKRGSLYPLFSLLDTRCPSWGWLWTHENPIATKTHSTPPSNRSNELQCVPWGKKKWEKNAKASVGSVQSLCGKSSHKECWNPWTIIHDEYRGMSANFTAVAFTSINSVCTREKGYRDESLGYIWINHQII